MLLTAFDLELKKNVLATGATLGLYDGKKSTLTYVCANDVLGFQTITNTPDNVPETGTLRVGSDITGLCAGRIDPKLSRDILAIGTKNSLWVYDVHDNCDYFFKDIPEGVGVLILAFLQPFNVPLVIVAGGCTVQQKAYDHAGNEVFWTLTGGTVTAMTTCQGEAQDTFLVVGSEDSQIRLFIGDALICELVESDIPSILVSLTSEHFGYVLENGEFGVYQKKKKLWKLKAPTKVNQLCRFDQVNDTDKCLVIAYGDGTFEGRSLLTGALLWVDNLKSSISSALLGIGPDLAHTLVLVTSSGHVRAVKSSKDPILEGAALVQGDLLDELRLRQGKLRDEIAVQTQLQAATQAVPTCDIVTEDILERNKEVNESVQIKTFFEAVPRSADEGGGLFLHVRLSGGFHIRMVLLRSDELFDGGTFTILPVPSHGIKSNIHTKKDCAANVAVTIVFFREANAAKMFSHTQELWLPRLAMFAEITPQPAEPPSKVTIEYPITLEQRLVLHCDDVRLLGEVLQTLYSHLGIQNFEPQVHVPRLLEKLELGLVVINERNEARMRDDGSSAEYLNSAKSHFIYADDQMQLGNMDEVKKHFLMLQEMNRSLFFELQKKSKGHQDLMDRLKWLNETITLGKEEYANGVITDHAAPARSRVVSESDHQREFSEKQQRLQTLIQKAKVILEDLRVQPGDTNLLHYPISDHHLTILHLNLSSYSLSSSTVLENTEDSFITQILLGKILESQHHLDKLYARISDIRSRVLVTGDLNAGKSTFVNAVLRREVVPDDQQPCTALFCEVVDADQNDGVEEVHGIKDHVAYNRNDPSTYERLDISTLRGVVEDNLDGFDLLKVYCRDNRPKPESLLHNGVVDISLIDSPGLNIDSMKTTSLFAQQEEIDVIIFVVNAENHFTLSGRQFLKTAGKEKAYIFIVVNRFDQIRRKDRCKRDILDQIKEISPLTYEDVDHLVHFVTARKTLLGQAEEEDLASFLNLEQNLRSFILEKRARSKLAPAKIYLSNLLSDIEYLCFVSQERAEARAEDISRDLSDNAPAYEGMLRIKEEFLDDVDKIIDETGEKAEVFARNQLSVFMDALEAYVEDFEWGGIVGVWQYTRNLRNTVYKIAAMRLRKSEEHAKTAAAECIQKIQDLSAKCMEAPPSINMGVVNSAFEDGSKEAGRAAAASVFIPLELSDFFAFTDKLEVAKAYLPSLGMMSTGLILYNRFQDNMLRSSANGMIKAGSVALSLAGLGLFCFVLSDMKAVVDRKVIGKMRKHFKDAGFLQTNPERIGKGTRRVLKLAIWEFQNQFQRVLTEQQKKRDSQAMMKQQAELAKDTFRGLSARAATLKRMVSDISLEEATR
ncbi:mitofusin [Dinochytrium kinnereticum]|nr:mitofusin [Dinochytrium kinnereticum]